MNRTRTFVTAVIAAAALAAPLNAAATLAPPTAQELGQAAQGSDMEHLESMARERLDAHPDDAMGWFYLGYALHLQGEIEEAIVAHAFATQSPQTAPLAAYNLGCAHALLGNKDKAFEALKKAVKLGVANPGQFQNDNDLASLRDDPRWDTLIASMTTPSAPTQSQSQAEPEPDLDDQALHFWVGEWDCYSFQNGTKVGYNTLAFRLSNNVIHESWESIGNPYKGESWNHFDPRTDEWVQTWIGTSGAPGHDIVEIRAKRTDDVEGLMFHGTSMEQGKPETTKKVRMHVYPIGDGLVRQVGGEWDTSAEAWSTRYDIIYVPKGRDFSLEDLSL